MGFHLQHPIQEERNERIGEVRTLGKKELLEFKRMVGRVLIRTNPANPCVLRLSTISSEPSKEGGTTMLTTEINLSIVEVEALRDAVTEWLKTWEKRA